MTDKNNTLPDSPVPSSEGVEKEERFTHYYTEMGDYMVVFDYGSDKEIPIVNVKSEHRAKLACINLNSIVDTLTAQCEQLRAEVEQLKRYTKHKDDCKVTVLGNGCTCKLDN